MIDRHSPLNRNPRVALLRRYLRAVLGDQATGDRLAIALQAGSAPIGHETEAGQPEASDVLCGALRRWRRLHQDAERAAPFSHGAIAQAISPSGALVRQAGILVDVFSLSIAQAAKALDRSEGEVTMLLSSARTAARTPIGKSVLIVEDDPLVGQHLKSIAKDCGATHVALAANADEALVLASQRSPEIVLCDYDLGPGKNGAEIVRELTAAYDCVCIFVTAYPNEVLQGSEGEPAFIISKPFAENVVRAAIAYAGSAERPAVLAA